MVNHTGRSNRSAAPERAAEKSGIQFSAAIGNVI